jgi:hypothetical protein
VLDWHRECAMVSFGQNAFHCIREAGRQIVHHARLPCPLRRAACCSGVDRLCVRVCRVCELIPLEKAAALCCSSTLNSSRPICSASVSCCEPADQRSHLVPSDPTAGSLVVTQFPRPALLFGCPRCCSLRVCAFAQGLKFCRQSAGYSSGPRERRTCFSLALSH